MFRKEFWSQHDLSLLKKNLFCVINFCDNLKLCVDSLPPTIESVRINEGSFISDCKVGGEQGGLGGWGLRGGLVPREIRESRPGLYPTTPTQTLHFKIHLRDKSHPASSEVHSELIV